MQTFIEYRLWLKKSLDSYAGDCSSYAREQQQSPPERLLRPYKTLLDAWEALKVIVDEDPLYVSERAVSFAMAYTNLPNTQIYREYLHEINSKDNSRFFKRFIFPKLPLELR